MIAPRLSCALLVVLSSVAALAADADPGAARIRLRDDSTLVGQLRASPDPQTVRWESPSFVAPFAFRWNRVNSIHFPTTSGPVAPRGVFGLELSGGNLLYGDLVSIDADHVILQLPDQAEPVQIERRIVHRIFRQVDDSSLVYLGPTGMEGWKQTEPKDTTVFRDESGQLVADVEGVLVGDISLPAQAACEVEISWKGDPDFSFDLGGPSALDPAKGALRIEVIDRMLVALRETGAEADLVPLQSLESGEGRIRFVAFIDQQKPQMLVFTPAGQLLADLQVAGTTASPWGVRLVNRKGTVRLERLRISRWNGARPQEVVASKSRLHRADGAIAYGEVESYDSQAGVFVVRDEQGVSRVPANEVTSLFLSELDVVEPGSIAVAGLDGTRLSGALLGIGDSGVRVQVSGVKQPIDLPIARLRSILSLATSTEVPAPGGTDTVGTLQVGDQFVRGWLVDARRSTELGCLVWRPESALEGVALRTGQSGRVIYKEPPPQPSAAELQRQRQIQLQQQQQQGAVINAGQRMVQALAGKFAQQKGGAKGPGKPLLHLRTGDTITCNTITVEEQGVVIESDSTDARRIPHDRIKVLELIPTNPGDVKLKKSKKERLLTLPRIQRPSPPTQLVRSTSGDFLRGRVTAMTGDKIQLEVRLENREVPRDLVSHIFWLHPDELDPNAVRPASETTADQTRVQAYRYDGFRLTFNADELAGGTLSGTSEILGACRVELGKIDQLMIGEGIEQAVAQLAYHKWKLKNATDPKFVSEGDDEGGGGNSGTDSPLVGKPAPDFELDLLDGSRFKLSGQKGRIIVLDFWATWCGPCIRAMPQVEAAVGEFPEDQVRLIAVNLQEQPKQIQTMLDRHKLNVTVALDADGVVAERYEASSIPQTVIIDPQGKIVRLFVGGSNDLGDQIKAAIQELLKPAS